MTVAEDTTSIVCKTFGHSPTSKAREVKPPSPEDGFVSYHRAFCAHCGAELDGYLFVEKKAGAAS